MADISALILAALAKKSYQPMSPKALARKLGLAETSAREFRGALKSLVREGKAQIGKNDTIRPAPVAAARHAGTFKRLSRMATALFACPTPRGCRPRSTTSRII